MNRLILCSGHTGQPGWLTLDRNPECQPDILAAIPPLPAAVWARKWDEIEWIHGVGSLDPWQAHHVLAELHDVLAPEGKLVLEQPDLRRAAEAILRDDSLAWWMFGDPSHHDTGMMNRWAYTPETLKSALIGAGFTNIALLPAKYHSPSRDFRMEARP